MASGSSSAVRTRVMRTTCSSGATASVIASSGVGVASAFSIQIEPGLLPRFAMSAEKPASSDAGCSMRVDDIGARARAARQHALAQQRVDGLAHGDARDRVMALSSRSEGSASPTRTAPPLISVRRLSASCR